jgi:basic amino acid/polyamine antiporter, APA family
MLRILGVTFGIAVGVGDIVGSGILRTPGEIASYLGSAELVLVTLRVLQYEHGIGIFPLL